MLHAMEIRIRTPLGFSFKRTAFSHGWTGLPPFEIDPETWTITRVLDLNGNAPVTVRITGQKRAIRVQVPRNLGKRAADSVTRDVRHMLRLDDDLADFYNAMRCDPDFDWIPRVGAGRLVRSP